MTGIPVTYNVYLETSSGNLVATDVTSLCTGMTYSQTIGTALSPLRADEGVFRLMNEAGEVNSLMAATPLIGRRVTLLFTSSNAVPTGKYSGRIQQILFRPTLGKRVAVIEALTEVDLLSRRQVTTPLLVNINVGSLFTEVLTRVMPRSLFVVDAIADTADFAWYDDHNALNVINQLMRSGYYEAYVGVSQLRIKNRSWGDLFTAVTSQITTEQDAQYALTAEGIVNKVVARATPGKQSTAVATVAYLLNPVLLPASGHAGFFINFLDPRNLAATAVGSTISQVASQDYHASANADGTGADYTSTLSVNMAVFGSTAVASVFNGTGVTAYLDRFQVRGYPVLAGSPISAKYEDRSSQAVYGLTEAVFDGGVIADQRFLQDLSFMVVNDRKDPRDRLTVSLTNFFGQNGDVFQDLSYLQLGQTVNYSNPLLSTNSSWRIVGMRHDVDLSLGVEHKTELELEKFVQRPWLVLNDPYLGVIDGDRTLAF